MNIDLKSIVRITSDSIVFDWSNPFNKSKNTESIGTGFFISDELILTCAHVVDSASKIYISIPSLGKTKYEITLISVCPKLDIALLKTNKYKSSSFIELGNSDNIKQTDKVYVIGYPLGQETVKYSSGIVSGLQEYLFQTDASINSGNSGGPLIDSNNKVIGINSSKIISSNENTIEGVGFSIPINLYVYMKDIMLTNKIIRKPVILLEFNNMNQNLWNFSTNSKKKIHYNNKSYDTGYYIKRTFKQNKLIDVHMGDILLELDGKKIDNYGEMDSNNITKKINIDNYLIEKNLNDKINMKFWSVKQKKIIEIDYKLDYIHPIISKYPNVENIEYFVLGGLVIMDLTLDHLALFHTYYAYFIHIDEMAFRAKPKVIISSILSSSNIRKDEIINTGDLLFYLNDVKINTLDDILNAIDTTFESFNGYAIIKNHTGNTISLNLRDALVETIEMYKTFNYKWNNRLSKLLLQKYRIKNFK